MVHDRGNGIKAIDQVLNGHSNGSGIINAKKLVDKFDIKSSARGTEVKLAKKLGSRFVFTWPV